MPQALKMACPLAKPKKKSYWPGDNQRWGWVAFAVLPFTQPCSFAQLKQTKNLIIYVSSKIFLKLCYLKKPPIQFVGNYSHVF